VFVRERYVGSVNGENVDESHDFVMRWWTASELRNYAAAAAFGSLRLPGG
jgi:hypothetical protein